MECAMLENYKKTKKTRSTQKNKETLSRQKAAKWEALRAQQKKSGAARNSQALLRGEAKISEKRNQQKKS